MQNTLETIVGKLHIELQLTSLLRAQLFRHSHLVQSDQPLDDLALVLEVTVSDFVDGLDGVDKNGVQCLLGQHVQLDGVQQCDEALRCRHDMSGRGVVGWLMAYRTLLLSRSSLNRRRNADA